jgi:ABC-type uncharacterized transport system permease subunit
MKTFFKKKLNIKKNCKSKSQTMGKIIVLCFSWTFEFKLFLANISYNLLKKIKYIKLISNFTYPESCRDILIIIFLNLLKKLDTNWREKILKQKYSYYLFLLIMILFSQYFIYLFFFLINRYITNKRSHTLPEIFLKLISKYTFNVASSREKNKKRGQN